MTVIAGTLARSTYFRLSFSLSATAAAAAAAAAAAFKSSFHLTSSPPSSHPSPSNPNLRSPSPPPSSPPLSPFSSFARHFGDWRSTLSHRAQIDSSAAFAERFERRSATMATRNSYESILTSLSKPGGGDFGKYYSLPALNDPRIDRLPYSIRILLESAIRNCDEFQVTGKDVEKILDWENSAAKQVEIPFKPARVLLQVPVDLVIDHSVQVDVARSENAVQANMELEFQRSKERFGFLKWGSNAFHNMLVVPPGSGIVHQPMSMVLPGVVGFKLSGKLKNGVTAIDLVLTATQMLRKHGVVGKFVEFYGEGMSELSLADRATIANISPEYGATMGFFPVDHVTLQYLKLTGRSDDTVVMIESYLRANKMFVDYSQPQTERVYSSYLELNLEDVEPCVSGPKRPHDRVPLKGMKADWHSCLDNKVGFKVNIDFETEPIGTSKDGKKVYFKDIWPSNEEIANVVQSSVLPDMFKGTYEAITKGNPMWNQLSVPSSTLYTWDPSSTYIHEPPYFKDMTMSPPGPHPVKDAYCLLNFGDSITTDHISPAGSIHRDSPAAKFLMDRGVERKDFNSYGSRRGNDEVMARGTFANIRLVNKFLKGEVGPKTVHIPTGEKLSVFDAAMRYKSEGHDTVILAGAEYGSGSSRDWAAKGPMLLGVKAVIAKSFERIHRSNLVGMGIIPLCFKPGEDAETLGLTGHERYTINLPSSVSDIKPGQDVTVVTDNGKSFTCIVRFDTEVELAYYNHGGILPFVIRNLINAKH